MLCHGNNAIALPGVILARILAKVELQLPYDWLMNWVKLGD